MKLVVVNVDCLLSPQLQMKETVLAIDRNTTKKEKTMIHCQSVLLADMWKRLRKVRMIQK
jgi:hypothetical protein